MSVVKIEGATEYMELFSTPFSDILHQDLHEHYYKVCTNKEVENFATTRLLRSSLLVSLQKVMARHALPTVTSLQAIYAANAGRKTPNTCCIDQRIYNGTDSAWGDLEATQICALSSQNGRHEKHAGQQWRC